MNRAGVAASAAVILLAACSSLTDSIDSRSSAECIEARSAGVGLLDAAREANNEAREAIDSGDRLKRDVALTETSRLIEVHALLVLGNPDCFGAEQRASAEQVLRERDRDRAQ